MYVGWKGVLVFCAIIIASCVVGFSREGLFRSDLALSGDICVISENSFSVSSFVMFICGCGGFWVIVEGVISASVISFVVFCACSGVVFCVSFSFLSFIVRFISFSTSCTHHSSQYPLGTRGCALFRKSP